MMGNPGPRGPPGYGRDGRNGERGEPGLCDPSQCYPKFPANTKGPGEKGPEEDVDEEPAGLPAEQDPGVDTVNFGDNDYSEAYAPYSDSYANDAPVLRLRRRGRQRHNRN